MTPQGVPRLPCTDDVTLASDCRGYKWPARRLEWSLTDCRLRYCRQTLCSVTGQTAVEPRAINVVNLQGHIRESMRKVLIALSPNLGISQEHLLSEFDQLIAPGCDTHMQSRDFEFAAGLASLDSPQGQLTFQHECL